MPQHEDKNSGCTGPEDWSVWTNNMIQKKWTFEFAGTREECLQYLDVATGPWTNRLWEFSLRRPGQNPSTSPVKAEDFSHDFSYPVTQYAIDQANKAS